MNETNEGKIAEGIVFLRGAMTHHLVKQVEPALVDLYPSDTLYPSEDLYPGSNFTWISADEMLAVHNLDGPQGRLYANHVAGQMMLGTLRVAIQFLLTDPQVSRLQ